MTQATIGVVSEGTHRTEDLLRAYRDKLSELDTDNEYAKLIHEAKFADPLDDDTMYVLDELGDALQEFCPEYVYFGAAEGDGACFGFWPDIEGAKEDGYVYDDLASAPAVSETIIVVNDHGNVTCYTAEIVYTEIWAVV